MSVSADIPELKQSYLTLYQTLIASIVILLISISFLKSESIIGHTFFEADFGFHLPQADYEKYVDPGLSLRFVLSNSDRDFSFIRYDISFQYLQFKREVWWEDDCFLCEDVKITNSEHSYSLMIGPRITNPTLKGLFRPYIGAKLGLYLFMETTKWEWGDDGFWCWLWDSCDEEEDYDESYTEVHDAALHAGWMLTLGSNFYFKRSVGLDMGIQYNVIPGIKRPVTVMDDVEQTIGFISKKVDADYVSFYLGVSIPLGSYDD